MTTKAFAGIGSESITVDESNLAQELASYMARLGWVLYSGNANGSDIAFQRGSGGRCVVFLPWAGFNMEEYNGPFIETYDVGKTAEGIASVARFHVSHGHHLKPGTMRTLARDHHQVMGYRTWPKVKFVICCANLDSKGEIAGGTGQACKIAASEGIPILNIRGKTMEDCITWFGENMARIKVA